MKKNPFLRWKRLVKCRSFFHVMSLTLILTLSSLSGYGAKAVRDTISLNLQEVKLERFVEVMKQKTGLNFLYNSLLFKDAKLISVTANGENWESVLRKVLEKEGFTYDVKDEIVVIKRKVENDHDIEGNDHRNCDGFQRKFFNSGSSRCGFFDCQFYRYADRISET